MHVHLREPGGEHKETILTGTAAAVAGGFGAVACMPNTDPVLDSPELIERVCRAKAHCAVYPIACISIGQFGRRLTNFGLLRRAGAVAVSDDGKTVEDEDLMRFALLSAADHGLAVISHCEPETEICERDITLAEETNSRLHIAHVSLRSTVEVIRSAKKRGVHVTAETCPHYLLGSAHGAVNPPLASEEDRAALCAALKDDTIDVIASDHAPHTAAEKEADPSLCGFIGLETSVGAVLTALYHTRLMSAADIFRKMRETPAAILGIPVPQGEIVVDTDVPWTPQKFVSMSSNCAFTGVMLRGRVAVCQPTLLPD
jgi:dihydroorotase